MEQTQVSNNTQEAVTIDMYSEITEKLRTEAKNRPAFNAVAHMFIKRERSRGHITLGALIRTMTKLDFNFSKEEYSEVLAFLGRIGVGVVDTDAKGRLRSLKEIRFTLQSIGMVATSKRKALLETHGVRSVALASPSAAPKPEIKVLPVDKPSVAIKLQVTMDGDTHTSFEVPNKITPNQLIALLAQFFNT